MVDKNSSDELSVPDKTIMPLGISAGRKICDLTDAYLRSLQRQGPLLEPAWLREAIAAEIRRRSKAAVKGRARRGRCLN